MLKSIRVLALLSVIAAGAAIGTDTAFAWQTVGVGAGEMTFYSDSSHREIVGSVLTDCDGNTYSWGSVTAYHRFERFSC